MVVQRWLQAGLRHFFRRLRPCPPLVGLVSIVRDRVLLQRGQIIFYTSRQRVLFLRHKFPCAAAMADYQCVLADQRGSAIQLIHELLEQPVVIAAVKMIVHPTPSVLGGKPRLKCVVIELPH